MSRPVALPLGAVDEISESARKLRALGNLVEIADTALNEDLLHDETLGTVGEMIVQLAERIEAESRRRDASGRVKS